jgi:Lon protease-like protein
MADRAELLPIFPLSSVVLFPKVQAPLHLFEPRYRQMAEHALAGDRCIGMVVVKPECADEMSGDPPVFAVGCAGHIARARKLPDGRYNIVLEGTHRFRIARETKRPRDRLYRVAEIERLEDAFDPRDGARVAELRGRVIELVSELLRRAEPRRASRFSTELFRGVDDTAFVNALSNSLAFPPEEKQGLLEANSIPDRIARLEGILSFRLAEFEALGSPKSGRLH